MAGAAPPKIEVLADPDPAPPPNIDVFAEAPPKMEVFALSPPEGVPKIEVLLPDPPGLVTNSILFC